MKKSVKFLVLVLVMMMGIAAFAACAPAPEAPAEEAPAEEAPAEEAPAEPEPEPEEEEVLDLTEETEPEPEEEPEEEPVAPEDLPKVMIGTKSYTEQRTMGEFLKQLIEAQTDYECEVINFGGSALLLEALKTDEVQVCADFTGTFYTVYLKAEEERGIYLRKPDEVYDYCVKTVKEEYDFDILNRIGFSNNYAFCIRAADKEALGIETVSELVPHAVDMRHTGSIEWFERPDALAAAEEAYGIEFKEAQPMDSGLMYSAIFENEVDCISAFTSDGRIAKFELALLEDDLGVLMPFDCCATIRHDFGEENPDVVDALMMLENSLTTEDMQRYNYLVDEEGMTNEEVAELMLQDIGLN